MSDTPRTDAHEASCGDYEKPHNYARRTAEFARQLERELAEANEERAPMPRSEVIDKLRARAEAAEAKLAAMTNERARAVSQHESAASKLWDACELLREWKGTCLDPYDGPEYTEWIDQFTKRIDALLSGNLSNDAFRVDAERYQAWRDGEVIVRRSEAGDGWEVRHRDDPHWDVGSWFWNESLDAAIDAARAAPEVSGEGK